MLARLATFSLFFFAGWTDAEVIKLDFGTEKSPVRAGFTRISDKSKPADGEPGWIESESLIGKDVPIDREWKFRESLGRSEPPMIFTTDLSRDHVESAIPATLRLGLPEGKYRVWVLCGAAGGNRSQVWDLAVRSGESGARATFPGPYESRILRFDVEANRPQLDLRFSTRSRWLVNAAVIAPVSDWASVQMELLDTLEREVRLLPAEELKKWKLTEKKDDGHLPRLSEEETRRGFLVYRRHYLSPIWPATKPLRREIGAPVRAYAAREDYEPLTFTVFPLRDFGELEVRVSDLTTSTGDQIRSEDIDVRYVRYLHVRPNYRVFGSYYRAPDVLMPMSPRPLVKDENFRVWMTLYVGPSTPEGLYRGSAAVSVDGQSIEVPLILRVLPFTLQKDRSLVIGQYYHHPYQSMATAPDAFSRGWWRRKAEQEHADMAAREQHPHNGRLVPGAGRRQMAVHVRPSGHHDRTLPETRFLPADPHAHPYGRALPQVREEQHGLAPPSHQDAAAGVLHRDDGNGPTRGSGAKAPAMA